MNHQAQIQRSPDGSKVCVYVPKDETYYFFKATPCCTALGREVTHHGSFNRVDTIFYVEEGGSYLLGDYIGYQEKQQVVKKPNLKTMGKGEINDLLEGKNGSK